MTAHRRTRDHFAKRAAKESYPARSVYKLEEIDSRVHLLRRGDKVLDLGAAPGSWTQLTSERVGSGGLVVAVDKQQLKIELRSNTRYIKADVLSLDPALLSDAAGGGSYDVVLSDMAPWTSGHRFVDQSRSFELFTRALDLAAILLRPGGRFAAKIFQGEEFEAARTHVRDLFAAARVIRPTSVRTESYEIYIVGLDRRRPA